MLTKIRFLLLCQIWSHCFYALDLISNIKAATQETIYIVCIDGGGSKTELQIIDKTGNNLILQKNGASLLAIRTGCSNINTVGTEGFDSIVTKLLDGLILDDIPLSSIINQCALIGGFAGVDSSDQKNEVKEIFIRHGFNKENIIITEDADVAANIIKPSGIALIAGTGSICLGAHEGKHFRVGGLGRLIGDEGSGYYVGLKALKACLEYEYGYGETSILVSDLRTHFNVTDLRKIIKPFYCGKITPSEVAALAPLIFARAATDKLAQKLVAKAAKKLGKLVRTTAEQLGINSTRIYVMGGLFKHENAHRFIEKIMAHSDLHEWQMINVAEENPTTTLVRKTLLSD